MWNDARIHEYSYEETVEMFVKNCVSIDEGNFGGNEDKNMIRGALSSTAPSQMFAKLYLTEYVEDYADISPNSNDEFVTTASTKKQVYEDYVQHCKKLNLFPVHLSKFYSIWSILFPTLKLCDKQLVSRT